MRPSEAKIASPPTGNATQRAGVSSPHTRVEAPAALLKAHRRSAGAAEGARRTPSSWRSDLLTAAAAIGLWLFSRLKFRVVSLGASELRLRPGLLLVATHRASGDVPIICGSLYFSSRVWAERRWHLHFTARDEFFERGFFAGYPKHLPIWLRRILYPVKISGGFSLVRVLSLRSGKTMKLGQVLAELPADAAVSEVLPAPVLEQLRARAEDLGHPFPKTAGAVLRGEYADLLWQNQSVDDLRGAAFAELWQRRKRRSREELRALIDLVGAGQPLLMFPEGRHSPDGRIGPLRPGVEILVSQGHPAAISYITLAYDPLTRHRTRVCAAFTAPQPCPASRVREKMLRDLKQAMPLTCGQVVASALLDAAATGRGRLDRDALARRVAAAVDDATKAGRPIDPALTDARAMRRRLDDCLAGLARKHHLAADRQHVFVDAERVQADQILLRLAQEYVSARDQPREDADRSRLPSSVAG